MNIKDIKFKNILITFVLFLLSLLASYYVLSKPLAILYDEIFNPNYGWWGSPFFVTLPFSYGFCIVFFFTLWNVEKYYYPMLLLLSPFLLLFWGSNVIEFLTVFVQLILPMWLSAFVLAKFIRLIISKFKIRKQSIQKF